MTCPLCDDGEFVNIRCVRVGPPRELKLSGDDDVRIATGPIVPYRCSRGHLFFVQAKDVENR